MDVWRAWCYWYPTLPPLSHMLRSVLKDRWLRIHNFGGEKRLPRSPGDVTELLKRNNTVATAVLSANSECLSFLACNNRDVAENLGRLPWFVPNDPMPTWILPVDLAEEVSETKFLISQFIWNAERFNEIIVGAASGQIGPVLVLSVGSGRIYPPYDGGADLFAEADAIPILRKRFAVWLSPLPSGL